jgi:hypothetical protein
VRNKSLAVGLAVTGLLLAACNGDDSPVDATPQIVIDDDAAGDAGENAVAAEGTEEEQAIAFAQCMRDEGLDWPDPITNSDGSIDLFGGNGPGSGNVGGGGLDGAVRGGMEVCRPLVEGASFLPDRAGGIDAEAQDAFLEFAQCLRDNGVDVDDPDFSDFGGEGAGESGGRFGDGFDPQDPANAEAIDACEGLFAGQLGR